MWDLASNQIVQVAEHGAPIKSVRWIQSPQYSCLVTGSWDKTVKFWDTKSPTPIFTIQLTERLYCADIMYPMAVFTTADRGIVVYSLEGCLFTCLLLYYYNYWVLYQIFAKGKEPYFDRPNRLYTLFLFILFYVGFKFKNKQKLKINQVKILLHSCWIGFKLLMLRVKYSILSGRKWQLKMKATYSPLKRFMGYRDKLVHVFIIFDDMLQYVLISLVLLKFLIADKRYVLPKLNTLLLKLPPVVILLLFDCRRA